MRLVEILLVRLIPLAVLPMEMLLGLLLQNQLEAELVISNRKLREKLLIILLPFNLLR